MSKKLSYTAALVLLACITGGILHLKHRQNGTEKEETPSPQTIIPKGFSKTANSYGTNEADTAETDFKRFSELNNDESFVDTISGDVNGDGVEDRIIAVKKLLDPFLYLIISIQNPITLKYERAEELRTAITQPKSLSFYLMEQENSLPAIVYSGMSSDNAQTLSIQKINKDKNDNFQFDQIIDLHADIQIRFKETAAENSAKTLYAESAAPSHKTFDSYKIYSYNSDTEAPNTLNQIQTEYAWSKRTNRYEKVREIRIPGEKIENRLLRKLHSGSTESFTEFLSGVWHLPRNTTDAARSLYFDKKNNIIIFNIDKIEEIYEIKSILPRRYGLFFNANNKSIPNIVRRIDVEIKGIDEIQVRVTENVARIRFATDSLWNGYYKKNTDLPQTASKTDIAASRLKKNMLKFPAAWESPFGSVLQLEANTYRLKKDNIEHLGFFDIITINEKPVLQIKDAENKNSFYLLQLEEDMQQQTITLTKIHLNINEILFTGDEPITFTRKIA